MRAALALLATTISLTLSGAAFAQDAHEAEEGQKIFKRTCFTCHTSEAGKNKVGPSLFGVVGRKSGSATGFAYSNAMKEANVTWSDETLDKYLADPKDFVPKNKMAFAGVKKDEDLVNIIAYLKDPAAGGQ